MYNLPLESNEKDGNFNQQCLIATNTFYLIIWKELRTMKVVISSGYGRAGELRLLLECNDFCTVAFITYSVYSLWMVAHLKDFS